MHEEPARGPDFRQWDIGDPVAFVRQRWSPDVMICLIGEGNNIGNEMYEAIEDGIDESVRERFIPGELAIVLGMDVIEDWVYSGQEEDQSAYRVRRQGNVTFVWYVCHVCVSFYSTWMPEDPCEFRATVFQLPRVRAIQARLENVLGPLRQAACWNY